MAFEPRRTLITLVCLASIGAARAASAEPTSNEKDTARELNAKGREATAAGRHADALGYFRQADEIMHLPSTGMNVARSLVAIGKLVEARDVALATTLIPPQPGEATLQATSRDDARKLASELTETIPTIELDVKGPHPRDVTVLVEGVVSRGGASVGRRLDPGTYAIELRAEGYVPAQITVTLAERDRKTTLVTLVRRSDARPTPPADVVGDEPSSSGPLAVFITGAALAGCGLAVGAGTGIASISLTDDLRTVCDDDGFCPRSARDDLAKANDLAIAADVSFIVAAVGGALTIAGGVWLAVTESSDEGSSNAVGLGLGPGGLVLHGRFR